jgi:nucleotide sugar dehydrogenase
MASHDHGGEVMNIGVIGVGRLGICFALLLDRGGYRVIGSDIRTNYVAGLNDRRVTTTEPGVSEMLKDCNIEFTTDTREVIQRSDIIYVMVATPSKADGSYDISAVQRVVQDVAESDFDISGRILVIGCTTNPGDCQRIQDQLRSRGVSVLYNPEFIAQGSIIRDLENADMVLIGGEEQTVMDRYKVVYHKIQPVKSPNIHTMSLTAAELVKIGTNCYLTTKISYANMVGEVLIRSGLKEDVDRALAAIGADSRVGHKYLRYGFGYGGPCLPRDNRAFAHYAKKIGLDFPLGTIVDQFNKDHSEFLARYFMSINPDRRPFYMASISYKPNTDIYEESQQLALCEHLLAQGYTVIVEPCDKMPPSVRQNLELQYAGLIRFQTRDQAGDTVEIPT